MGTSEPVPFRIERATEHDVGLILRLIKGLAEYERLSHEVVATEAGLRDSLFGHRPAAEVVIAYRFHPPSGELTCSHISRTSRGDKPSTATTTAIVIQTGAFRATQNPSIIAPMSDIELITLSPL